MKSKRKTKSKSIAILSITLALIIILQLFSALLQKLGMPMSLALGLIPVLVVSQTHGIKYGAASGFFFGLITLLFSVIYMGAIPIYKVSANPLVSVFPRIMTGVVCASVYAAFMKRSSKRETTLLKRRIYRFSASAVSAALGVITNTVLYLGMFFAFAHGKTYDDLTIDFKWIISSIVALNTVIELALFTVSIPPIVYAMTESKLAEKFYSRLNKNTAQPQTDDCENDCTEETPDVESEENDVIDRDAESHVKTDNKTDD